MLHGYGADPAGAADLAEALDPDGRMVHIVPSGPLDTPGGRAWFDPMRNGHAGVLGAAVVVIDSLLAGLAEEGIGRDEIAIVGWSQGGAAALAALGRPDTDPVGSLALLGAFSADDPDIEFTPSQLAATRVFSAHGSADDIVPVEFADDLATWMEAEGVSVDRHRHPGGHELPDTVVVALSEWLAASLAP